MRRARGCGAANCLLRRSNAHYFYGNSGHSGPAPAKKGNSAMLRSIFRFLRSWRRYNTSLRQLSHLDDRQLADIGISRSDIPRAAWDAAEH